MAYNPDMYIFVFDINGKNHYFRQIKSLNFRVAIAREVNGDGSPKKNAKVVVLKKLEYKLPTNGAKLLESIAMMKESWKRICKLNHPNVLPCICAVLNERTFSERFLTGTQIMDHSPVGDLHEYVKGNPILCQERAKHFSYQLLSGIDYIHSQFSMIHGDIKPQNIIVFPDAKAKYEVRLRIIDFDHHAALEASVTQTKDGKKVLGTRRYMSPEMILEEKPGRRTDIWSFGCVVLDMLSGKEPFVFAYHETGFSDPFDPALKNKPFRMISEQDYRFGGGFAVPYIPSSIVVDPDCQNFLKACLTVDVQKRALAATLLSHPWLADENSEDEITDTSIILLQRQEHLLEETDEYPEMERQWVQGIKCATMLLKHYLLSDSDQPVFENISQSLLEQLRTCTWPFSADQLRMCVEHLERKVPTLPEPEREPVQITKRILESSPSACKSLRPFFPVVLSMKTLAGFMNKYCHSIGTQRSFIVKTNLVWKDVKSALENKVPVICQIAVNETDQRDDVLDGAKMVWLAHICPLQLIELEFVIVNGYKETKKGEVLVCITRAGGEKVMKTLSDFEAAWNWKASDSLMQQYLMLDGVLPASALLRS